MIVREPRSWSPRVLSILPSVVREVFGFSSHPLPVSPCSLLQLPFQVPTLSFWKPGCRGTLSRDGAGIKF